MTRGEKTSVWCLGRLRTPPALPFGSHLAWPVQLASGHHLPVYYFHILSSVLSEFRRTTRAVWPATPALPGDGEPLTVTFARVRSPLLSAAQPRLLCPEAVGCSVFDCARPPSLDSSPGLRSVLHLWRRPRLPRAGLYPGTSLSLCSMGSPSLLVNPRPSRTSSVLLRLSDNHVIGNFGGSDSAICRVCHLSHGGPFPNFRLLSAGR